MKEFKPPGKYTGFYDALFLAGGITNCSLWQPKAAESLAGFELDILNPRRDEWRDNWEEEQIKWEHDHILRATSYLFWFCSEKLCPITLFELGKVAGMFPKKPLFVGTHPDYARRSDVRIQMLLLRPEVVVVHDLDELIQQVKDWLMGCGIYPLTRPSAVNAAKKPSK